MILFYDMKSNMYNVFILKCVSIRNINIEHYIEGAALFFMIEKNSVEVKNSTKLQNWLKLLKVY